MTSITHTASDVSLAQTAIDALGRKRPLEQDVHNGLLVIRDWIGQGATIETIAAMTDRSVSNVGRLKTIGRVLPMVAATDGAGILDANKALNAATSPVKTLVAPWEKDGRTFTTWAAVTAAIKAAQEDTSDDDDNDGEKSQADRWADLLKHATRYADRYNLDPVEVAMDLVSALESAGEDAQVEADLAA